MIRRRNARVNGRTSAQLWLHSLHGLGWKLLFSQNIFALRYKWQQLLEGSKEIWAALLSWPGHVIFPWSCRDFVSSDIQMIVNQGSRCEYICVSSFRSCGTTDRVIQVQNILIMLGAANFWLKWVGSKILFAKTVCALFCPVAAVCTTSAFLNVGKYHDTALYCSLFPSLISSYAIACSQ